jgi:histidyl-tRNA synthetase
LEKFLKMSVQKPSIPKGTRDFGQKEMARRNYIFDTIRSVFRTYGYQEIQTPAQENLSTLLGKYGEEGDKLLFRILNSGDAFGSVDFDKPLTPQVCEKGLRYDLTVPFARYVVQHQSEISFPFKRFQIQPVWRADRPQKGRYREFYQCDVDVIGTESLVSEWELIEIVKEVYRRFGLRVVLKLNNRKILAGIAEYIGAPDKMIDITVAIDKLDKIGQDKVNEELLERGLSQDSVQRLQPVLALSGTNEDKLHTIAGLLADSEIGRKGVEEVRTVLNMYNATTSDKEVSDAFSVELDLTLARGLNYYTGAIFEVKARDVQIGSITGGGRYDNLTGIFGLPDVSGVGISFGADRIYDCLTALSLFPPESGAQTELLLVPMGEQEMQSALCWARDLRSHNKRVEVYPDLVKIKKQLSYADANRIPFVAIIGSEELASQTVTLKNMLTGEQSQMTLEQLLSMLDNYEHQR